MIFVNRETSIVNQANDGTPVRTVIRAGRLLGFKGWWGFFLSQAKEHALSIVASHTSATKHC